MINIIASLAGLVVPPAYDFIKKKFLRPSQDTPQATISSLATTKPEVIPQYVEAQSKFIEAQIKYFNRDVVGELSLWVRDLRGAIRPCFVICSIILVGLGMFYKLPIPQSYQVLMDTCISSWFGSKIMSSQ